jgi:hypothetical protein
VPANADELRHADVAVEAWWWWAWAADARAGLFVGLELRGRRFDYWAGLVRCGEPYLYVEELEGTGLRDGLEIKPPEMWADHSCDVPSRSGAWATKAHGVLLDDALGAMGRPYTPVPVTFDLEWYAAGDPAEIAHGYEQAGEVDAQVELDEGMLSLKGPPPRPRVGCALRPTTWPCRGRGAALGPLSPARRPGRAASAQSLGFPGSLGKRRLLDGSALIAVDKQCGIRRPVGCVTRGTAMRRVGALQFRVPLGNLCDLLRARAPLLNAVNRKPAPRSVET